MGQGAAQIAQELKRAQPKQAGEMLRGLDAADLSRLAKSDEFWSLAESLAMSAQPEKLLALLDGIGPANPERRRLDGTLLAAVRSKDTLAVLAAVEHGASPDAAGPRGSLRRPAAALAAAGGDEATLCALLEAGADPNGKDWDGEPLLGLALAKKMGKAFSLALAKGADPNAKAGSPGEPLVVKACMSGQEGAAMELLAAGADPDCKNARREPLLKVALAAGRQRVFFEALERGANPNAKGGAQGRPLLIEAISLGLAKPALALLDKGALASSKDADGEPALLFAGRKGLVEVFWALLEAKAEPGAFCSSSGRRPLAFGFADLKDEEAVIALLDAGANPDAKDGAGLPLTHCLVRKGLFKAAAKALEKGADPNAKSPEGRPLSFVLVSEGQSDLAIEALRAGADPDGEDSDKEPLLCYAAARGAQEVFREALLRGADPDKRDRRSGARLGFTLARLGQEWSMRLLAQAGVDWESAGPGGQTLRSALAGAGWGHLEQEPQALGLPHAQRRGAQAAARGKGKALLWGLMAKAQKERFEAALKAGANPNETKRGRSLFEAAAGLPDEFYALALARAPGLLLDEEQADRVLRGCAPEKRERLDRALCEKSVCGKISAKRRAAW